MITATDPIRDDSAPVAATPRVLVFRSCRLPQFLTTIAWIRAQWPAAAIDVVTAPGFDAQLREAGAARTFAYAGASFGMTRNLPLVQRLRADAFDDIVIPQMSEVAGHHANLYRAGSQSGGVTEKRQLNHD